MVDRNKAYHLAHRLAQATRLSTLTPVRSLGVRAMQRIRTPGWLTEATSWVTIDGMDLQVYPRVHLGQLLTQGEKYEQDLRDVLRRIVHSGDVVIDVGAHWGYHTTLLATLVGAEGRVIAFEPLSINRRLLLASIERNDFVQVTVLDQALTDHDGDDLTLTYPFDNLGSSTLRFNSRFIDPGTEMVRSSRLDTALSSIGFDFVDLMKIDVEGAETLVLRGSGDWLRKVGHILIELHPQYLDTDDYMAIDNALVGRSLYQIQNNGLVPIVAQDDLRFAGHLLASQIPLE